MIQIKELNELDIPKYNCVFQAVYDMFGSFDGIYYKLEIDGEEKILHRCDDLFTIFSVLSNREVEYEMFTIYDDYSLKTVRFEDFEVSFVDGMKIFQDNDCDNLESVFFHKRSNGVDEDGYNGMVSYRQYNQKDDVMLTIVYQHPYNGNNRIYNWYFDLPFQLLLEKNCKKIKFNYPGKVKRYIRGEIFDGSLSYDIITIQEFGLKKFLENGAYALQKENSLRRYFRILHQLPNDYVISSLGIGTCYQWKNFSEIFERYGFRGNVPDYMINIYNGDDKVIETYQSIANFMKKLEIENDEIKVLKLSPGDENDD